MKIKEKRYCAEMCYNKKINSPNMVILLCMTAYIGN